MLRTQEQQQLDLLSVLHPENIFNSDSSLPTFSDIVESSCFDSFLDVENTPIVTMAATSHTLSFLDSTAVSSSDQPVQCPSSYKLNSAESTVPSACSSVNLPTLVAPEISLKTFVDSKRHNLQLRDQYRNRDLNFLPDSDALPSSFLRYLSLPLVRGTIIGGYCVKPPKKPLIPGTTFVAASLRLENSTFEDMCLPEWNKHELEDRRRIVRIERRRQSNEIVASFSIVGSTKENPQTEPALDPNVEIVEVSCLQCLVDYDEIKEKESFHGSVPQKGEPDSTEPPKQKFTGGPIGCDYISNETPIGRQYYITSVEVIKIIEILVGSHLIQDPQKRRRERACIRSNLMPFWSKHLVSSSKKALKRLSVQARNDDFLAELDDRIQTYKVRKPRIVDKDVKILEWSRLGPALKRALQSYYAVVSPTKSRTKVVPENSDKMHKMYQY
ncbi:BA75_03317T0 [Komagataella pastoris]|uniref:BA75_03317T0 n=1 Tax=Komagataella pastoris TaxID=4922 RepID=A0A1B2JCG9_PICPA|nr:BA75_03317T0 [Komagataella pastoris]